MLTVNLLGAPDIIWHETRVDLPRRQARALLYRLATDPRPVPREQLIYLFWPDVPDKKARKNLSRLVSFLGSSLPEGLLVLGRESIGLDANHVTCDVRAFIGHTEDGAANSLERAAGLYRGSFLSGFRLSNAPEFENWTFLKSELLERRFLNALARLVEDKSSSGDFAGAIHYGQRYLATDNLAEEIHRQLITLYMMSGDRASALRQYEVCVATLEGELGVGPLPETRAAYEAALADQSASASPVHEVQAIDVTWSVLPSLDLPLTGRQEALTQLERAFERAQSGGFIFISGEPGVGKSRLLKEFASGNDERLVLVGNGYESARDLPYQPIVQAIRPALSAPDLWLNIRPIWLAEVAAILPEVANHFEGLPARIQVEPEQAQTRLFEAIAQVMLGLAKQRPLLMCLDDLHWADAATLAYLAYLVSRLPASGVCVVATFRTQEAEPLGDLRQTLRRAGLQEHITLSGLGVDAIAAILGQIPATNDQSPSPIRRPLPTAIYQATAGNAFFVLETIRTLVESGNLEESPVDLPLPPTVQEAIRRRLERLDPLSRQILEAAAIISPEISFELLEPVAGRSEDEVVDGLEALINRQLLAGSGEELHFQHELARVVVYEDLSLWRRRLLHRRTAEALANRQRGQQDQAAAQIARHYEAAGEIELACSFYRDAASVAQSLYAYREANHYLQRTIDLQSEKPVAPQDAARLYEAMADNYRAMALYLDAESAYLRALEITPPEPSLKRADLLRKLAAAVQSNFRLEEADQIYHQALEVFVQGRVSSGLERRRFWLQLQFDRLALFYFQSRLEDMAIIITDMEPVVHDLDEPFYWCLYYSAWMHLTAQQERFRASFETVEYTRRGLEYARQDGNRREIANQLFYLGFTLLCAGEFEEAAASLEEGLVMAEEIGYIYSQTLCLAYLGILHRLRGDIAQTKVYLERSSQTGELQKHRFYLGVDHSAKAWLAYRKNDWLSAVAEARQAMVKWEGTDYPFQWLANWIILAHGLKTGDFDEAKSSAAAMLSPKQQPLADDVAAALEAAVAAEEFGQEETVYDSLKRALTLAIGHGYL